MIGCGVVETCIYIHYGLRFHGEFVPTRLRNGSSAQSLEGRPHRRLQSASHQRLRYGRLTRDTS